MGGRVVPVSGVEHHRYITGQANLERMLRAGGVAEESAGHVAGLVESGELAGPRLLAVRAGFRKTEQEKNT